MKVLVMSDSHGDVPALRSIMQAESDSDAVIYLGDGLHDMRLVQADYPALPVYAVRGNCDYDSLVPSESFSAFAGTVVLYTHGNGYEIKTSFAPLRTAARERGAEVVLFGHTHRAYYAYEDEMYFFNPGAVTRSGLSPSYGIMTIEGSSVHFEHKPVPLEWKK